MAISSPALWTLHSIMGYSGLTTRTQIYVSNTLNHFLLMRGQAILMTYKEFQRQLGKAGLSVKEFSELIGMNRNSITNYARQEIVPSHLAIIVSLMGEMADQGIDFRPVVARIEVSPKKARGAGGSTFQAFKKGKVTR